MRRSKKNKKYQGYEKTGMRKDFAIRRERGREKKKHIGDEVKKKSLISSGNGTCGAELCFPNIPEG